jgi:hypothetical protein
VGLLGAGLLPRHGDPHRRSAGLPARRAERDHQRRGRGSRPGRRRGWDQDSRLLPRGGGDRAGPRRSRRAAGATLGQPGGGGGARRGRRRSACRRRDRQDRELRRVRRSGRARDLHDRRIGRRLVRDRLSRAGADRSRIPRPRRSRRAVGHGHGARLPDRCPTARLHRASATTQPRGSRSGPVDPAARAATRAPRVLPGR